MCFLYLTFLLDVRHLYLYISVKKTPHGSVKTFPPYLRGFRSVTVELLLCACTGVSLDAATVYETAQFGRSEVKDSKIS